MKEKKSDIAKGTFIKNWPDWLRWALFIPAGVIGGFSASALYLLINNMSGDYSWESWLVRIIQSVIFGLAVVYFAAAMAPKYQFEAGLLFLVILCFVLGMSWAFSLNQGLFGKTASLAYYSFHDFLCIAGAIGSLVTIKQTLDKG